MSRLQKILLAALMFWAFLGIGISLYPFEGFMLWVARAGLAIDITFVLSIVTLLFLASFPGDDDPWDSSYFKFMRNLWEHHWGGFERYDLEEGQIVKLPFSISVCQATFLSAITLFLFLLSLFCLGMSWYLSVQAIVSGFDFYLVTSLLEGEHYTFSQLFVLFVLFQAFSLIVLIYLYSGVFRYEVKKSVRNITYKILIITVCTALLALAIGPLHTFGLSFLKWYGLFLVGGSLIIALFWGIVWVAIKINKEFSQSIPIGLLRARVSAWKKGVCPFIVQGYKNKKDEN